MHCTLLTRQNMVLAVNIMHGHDPSNKMCLLLQPKNTKITVVNITAKGIIRAVHYILVKAPLRVLYDKIQHEGWSRVANTARGKAECCICHEIPPLVLYFIVQHEYTVLLLICWVCVRGLRGGLLAHSADSVSNTIGLLLNAP